MDKYLHTGTQGIPQNFPDLAAAARTHYGTDSLSGKLIVTAGLGGMGELNLWPSR